VEQEVKILLPVPALCYKWHKAWQLPEAASPWLNGGKQLADSAL